MKTTDWKRRIHELFPNAAEQEALAPHPGPRAGSRSRAAATSLSLSPRPENVCRLRFKKRTRH